MSLTFNCPILGSIQRRLEEVGDFLTDPDTKRKVEVGCVVAAAHTDRQRERAYLLKKSHTKGYAYSGMWALPGGMIRVQHASISPQMLINKASDRTQSETHVALQPESRRFASDVPPVTEYDLEEKAKHCTVIVLHLQSPPLSEADVHNIRPNHHLVEAVQVTHPLRLMSDIAPANRVIIARLIWPDLTRNEQIAIQGTVSEAVDVGNAIAEDIGFPPLFRWFYFTHLP